MGWPYSATIAAIAARSSGVSICGDQRDHPSRDETLLQPDDT